MNALSQIKKTLSDLAQESSTNNTVFFKTNPGGYAEHDQFIGVSVPDLRKIAKDFSEASLDEISKLLKSKINEERLLALILLVNQYQKSDKNARAERFQFYLDHLKHVNNWNLVDSSAHLIIGAHILNDDKKLLLTLAKSKEMWERRIAIVSTWYFIRKNQLESTFKIAQLLLKDDHDLIHKAVGWMLREAGKKDEIMLIEFLDQHATKMPRTMLRYSIEKFPDTKRKYYLSLK